MVAHELVHVDLRHACGPRDARDAHVPACPMQHARRLERARLAEEVVVADLGRDVAVLLTVRQQLLVLRLLPGVVGRAVGAPRDEVDDAVGAPVGQDQPPAEELAHLATSEHEEARRQRLLAARAAGLGEVLEQVTAAPAELELVDGLVREAVVPAVELAANLRRQHAVVVAGGFSEQRLDAPPLDDTLRLGLSSLGRPTRHRYARLGGERAERLHEAQASMLHEVVEAVGAATPTAREVVPGLRRRPHHERRVRVAVLRRAGLEDRA